MSPRSFLACTLLLISACSATDTESVDVGGALRGFDEVDTKALPGGLTVATGKWEVVADSTAPSPGHVLAQIARSPSRDFNLLLFEDSLHQDVDVSVSFRSIAGEVDRGGGPVWRAEDASNYYIARYNPLEDNYRVYKVVDGRRHQLQSLDIDHSSGWHTLRIRMFGDLIRCSYDGRPALEVHDTTFPGPGKIGLWTKADAQTHFDDLRVR